jgi:hypothetical protein
MVRYRLVHGSRYPGRRLAKATGQLAWAGDSGPCSEPNGGDVSVDRGEDSPGNDGFIWPRMMA